MLVDSWLRLAVLGVQKLEILLIKRADSLDFRPSEWKFHTDVLRKVKHRKWIKTRVSRRS
jgi:hypothetical protein